MIRIAGIEAESIVDGPGIRFVIFAQGCCHYCPDCQNPQTWPRMNGTLIAKERLLQMVYDSWLVQGVTFSGWEPFLQHEELTPLAKELKAHKYSLWCYTGFLYEDVKDKPLMQYIDVLVDGKFDRELKSYECLWRGSSNQRLIDVPKSLASGAVTLWEG